MVYVHSLDVHSLNCLSVAPFTELQDFEIVKSTLVVIDREVKSLHSFSIERKVQQQLFLLFAELSDVQLWSW